jgi:large subunit ribosomal protein L22
MEAQAIARYIRISPRKARYVADLVRGKKVEEALDVLTFTPRKASVILIRLLKSAIANAGQSKGVDVDTLYVKTVMVDGGPSLKRFRPRPMGRATRILKRTSHITMVLAES